MSSVNGETARGPVRVVITTPVRFYRDGLAAVLGRDPLIRVLAATATAADVLACVVDEPPDVVLLDLPLPDGPAAARDLLAVDPSLRVVALAAREVEDDVLAWAEAGASGYVSHASSIAELGECIHQAVRGEVPCPPRIATMLLRLVNRLGAQAPPPAVAARVRVLTRREREIAALIASGYSNKEIAHALGIRVPTVKNHVSSIFDKLDVRRRRDVLMTLTDDTRSLVGTY